MQLDNLDIFAAQYVVVYDRLKAQYPWMATKTLMVKSKETTVEFLDLKLRMDLPKEKKVWPEGFTP